MLDGWISPWWQAVCLPRLWDVCGVRVNALSVWHTLALENIGNRYLCGGMPTRDDATSLLLFAQGNRASGLRMMLGPNYRNKQMKRMARKVKRMNWPELDEACRDYIDTCTRTPRRWTPEGAGPNVQRVPYQLHFVRALCSEYGYTEAQAWDTPYEYARILYDSYAEANGDTSIASIMAEAQIDENVAKGIDPLTGEVHGGDSTT